MGYYFLAFGTLVCVFALWTLWKCIALLVFGTRCEGVIVGVDEQMRRGNSQRKKVYFHPVIEFETADGNAIQFVFGSGATRTRPAIGDKVRVVYEHGRPQKATLNSFMGLWAGPLAAATLGGGCVYAGVQIVFFDA